MGMVLKPFPYKHILDPYCTCIPYLTISCESKHMLSYSYTLILLSYSIKLSYYATTGKFYYLTIPAYFKSYLPSAFSKQIATKGLVIPSVLPHGTRVPPNRDTRIFNLAFRCCINMYSPTPIAVQ
jgi:hypothetical protein